jgi:two-component system sensor histidine kinase KdpD
MDEIAAAAVRHVSGLLGGRAFLLLPDGDHGLAIKGGDTDSADLDAKEMGVARWSFEHAKIAGRETSTLPAAAGLYVPLKGSRGCVGVMGVMASGDGDHGLESDRRQLAESFGSQIALAVERAALAEEAREAWERVEAEFLRNTLLSGVSHDLRTPLAAIMGAATALSEAPDTLPVNARLEMLDTIQNESERMERLIGNLLDMTRLESGGLVLRREWQPLAEPIGAALRHLERRLRGREVKIDLPPSLALAHIDGVSIEQVILNLIDNAVEYTPSGTPIELSARDDVTAGLIVEVADRGPGLPPGTERRVFDKFFRATPGNTRRGIGLGLAICRAIVEAHGGTITAAKRPDGGAVFRFTLPRDSTPPQIDSTE